MAARKWGISNYNAFLREAKKEFGIDHRTAQKTYRAMADRAGAPQRAADIKRHPRIAADSVKVAVRIEAREHRQKIRERKERARADRAAGALGQMQARANEITSVAGWQQFLGGFTDAELVDLDLESSEDPFITEGGGQ